MIGMLFSLLWLVISLSIQALVLMVRLTFWLFKLTFELIEMCVHAAHRTKRH